MEFKHTTDIDIKNWLNKPQQARLTGQWEIYSFYKLTGYSQRFEDQYCIDYSPMNEIANLPIILEKKQILLISQTHAKRILGEEYSLFTEKAFGIKKLSLCEKYESIYIEGTKYHTVRSVIEGFFWWFPSTPEKLSTKVSSPP